jgi:nucleotide-binding universal stress UspA family protein
LRFLAPFNESHTVPVEHIVAAGDAAERISEYARRFAVDLVVLGAPQTELTEEDLDTSTVLQVIAKVGCPVLCLALPGVTSGELKSDVALAGGFAV